MICISESEDNEVRKYCVYWHKNKINGKLYIGMSCNVKIRWQANGVHYKPCKLFYNAILKYGWNSFEHVILKDGLTKKEAQDLEIELIKKYRTQDPKIGYNLTSGGDGCSELPRGMGKDHHASKPVYQYDLNGDFIRMWENAGFVEREIGILATDIGQVARGNLYIAGDYIWRYTHVESVQPYHLKKYRNIPIYQIDEDFKLIKIYDDVYHIDKKQFDQKVKSHDIIQCCLQNRVRCAGYYWCFAKDYENFQQYIIDRKDKAKSYLRKPIYQYDENYSLIAVYDSAKEAASLNNLNPTTLKAYCGRGQANHGFKNTGYYWYYAEDMERSDTIG